MRNMFLRANSQFICFEGDGGDGGDGDGDGDGGGDKKMFDQEQLNTIVAEEKRKMQERTAKVVSELESLRKSASLTAKEKAGLEKRLEDIKTENMTAEEKVRREIENAEKRRSAEMEELTAERDTWQRRHATLVVDTAITRAAVDNQALHPEQILALVIPKTKLVESLDDEGKPTGVFEPKVSFPDKNKKGEDIILELSPSDAVKRMRELEQYGNLFSGGKKGGLGSTGSQTKGSKIDLAKMAREDPAAYRKIRKEKPELFASM